MRTGLTTAALTLIPTAAFAHPAIGDAHGFVAGFAHPLGGLDHILAMVTVGIFAWQLGGRALWLVPATFVLAMAAGGALGMAGVPVPFVELGIAASVIVLGTVVAFARRAPVAIAVGLVGVFAGGAAYTQIPDQLVTRKLVVVGPHNDPRVTLFVNPDVGAGMDLTRADDKGVVALIGSDPKRNGAGEVVTYNADGVQTFRAP